MQTPSSAEMHAMQAAATAAISPFGSIEAFNEQLPMAEFLSRSTIIHSSLQDNPANCMLIIEIASRLNLPVMSLAQDLQIVDGKLTWPNSVNASLKMLANAGEADSSNSAPCTHELVSNTAEVGTPALRSEGTQKNCFANDVPSVASERVQIAVCASPAADVATQTISSGCNLPQPVPRNDLAKGQQPVHGAAGDSTTNWSAPHTPGPVLNTDLATFKEICLRSETSEQVAAAAAQLPDVLTRDRHNAEKEVLEMAMIFLAEESTGPGMRALAEVSKHLNHKHLDIFKAAYNGRVAVLNSNN